MSGALERLLLARGGRVVRVPPKLMAGARERGKSDVIDAVAIARAATREALDTLPMAELAGPISTSGCSSITANDSSGSAPS